MTTLNDTDTADDRSEIMTATVLIQGDDHASIADTLRRIADRIESGIVHGRSENEHDYDIVEGAHLDAIDRMIESALSAPVARGEIPPCR